MKTKVEQPAPFGVTSHHICGSTVITNPPDRNKNSNVACNENKFDTSEINVKDLRKKKKAQLSGRLQALSCPAQVATPAGGMSRLLW